MHPENAEFLNGEIYNYVWIKSLWETFDHRCMGVGSFKGGSSSKGDATCKCARSGRSAVSSKGTATCKKWYDNNDYDSADDFVEGKIVQVTFRPNCIDLFRNEVNDNSDDDFMYCCFGDAVALYCNLILVVLAMYECLNVC